MALSHHVHHPVARDWLEAESALDSIAFCRATQQTLLRLLTNAAVLAPYGNPPLTNREAWAIYAAFLADDRITWADEPDGLESRWRKWAVRDTASPKLWMDSYLAAFAGAEGYTMVTTDAVFGQFLGLDSLILAA